MKVLKHTAREEDRNDFQKEARNMIRVAAGVENNFIIRLRGICYGELPQHGKVFFSTLLQSHISCKQVPFHPFRNQL